MVTATTRKSIADGQQSETRIEPVGGQYQPLTKRMFTALRDEIDPTIAAISTLMTAASFLLVLIASTRQKKSG